MKIIDKDDVLHKYLKLSKCLKIDHTNTVCCNCRKGDTFIRPNGRPLLRVCVCKRDNCSGYICNKCYCKNQYDDVIKPMRKYSMGKISIYENNGMGLLGECVVAKYFGIRDCVDCDILKSYGHNYQNSCDLYLVKYKNLKIQVKTRTPRYREWRVSSRLSKNKDFNILYILCMNKYLENIEKAYAIPIEEMFERSGINTRKDPKVISWFEKYKIDKMPLNDSLCYILSKLIDCHILKKE